MKWIIIKIIIVMMITKVLFKNCSQRTFKDFKQKSKQRTWNRKVDTKWSVHILNQNITPNIRSFLISNSIKKEYLADLAQGMMGNRVFNSKAWAEATVTKIKRQGGCILRLFFFFLFFFEREELITKKVRRRDTQLNQFLLLLIKENISFRG